MTRNIILVSIVLQGCYMAPPDTHGLSDGQIAVGEWTAWMFDVPQECQNWDDIGVHVVEEDPHNNRTARTYWVGVTDTPFGAVIEIEAQRYYDEKLWAHEFLHYFIQCEGDLMGDRTHSGPEWQQIRDSEMPEFFKFYGEEPWLEDTSTEPSITVRPRDWH